MHLKPLHTLSLFLFAYTLLPNSLTAQKKAVIRPGQLTAATATSAGKAITPWSTPQGPGAQARTTTVAPVALGTTSNFFSSAIPMNNCVHADDSASLLTFVHRQNTSVWGSTNGLLRYDISTDRGQTWTNDIGPVNPVLVNARYPQIAGYRPAGSTSPLVGAGILVSEGYTAPVWQGLITGTTSLVTAGSPSTQESQLNFPTQIPGGGLAEGKPGEYWVARLDESGGAASDSMRIFKGVYNPGTQVTTWSQHLVKHMPWDISFSGSAYALAPTVAFSPDGNTGWIATLGDINGVMDSVYAPILLKSTDAGATWSAPQEIDLNSFAWVADSLRALWIDSLSNPASSGQATAAFHYDLTVDAAGNPHMFFVIGTAYTPGNYPQYSISSGLSKYAVDLSSTNQGSTFDLRLVAPVLTFRGIFGSGTSVDQDNYPQVSRTQDGQYIFYSWIDSDTSQFTGSMSGIGFGNADNIAPDLRIAGLRIADGYSTCLHLVTDGDVAWGGRALSMQLAPEVLKTGSGVSTVYKLPIVGLEMLNNDPNQPCAYHYFGNDALLTEGDFAYPPGSSVYWNGCGLSSAIASNIQGKVYADFNNNGVFDGTDVPVQNRVVYTNPVHYVDLSDASGDFDISCLANQTYGLVTLPFNPAVWTPSVPAAPYAIPSGVAGTVTTGKDFAFIPVASAEDLLVALYTAGGMRAGFPNSASIYVQNMGTQPSTGTLTFHYDSLASVLGATPAYATLDTVNRLATWNLPSIPVFGTYVVNLSIGVDLAAALGSSIQFDAQVALTGIDADLSNNADTINVPIIGSYDPNDKNVFPAGNGSNHQVDPGTALKYRIRFQNTGTASAINVVVRDTLDTDLEVLSLQPLGASHAHSLSIEQGRILVWSFNGIHLPDSNTNEPASHGYIDFSIAPKPGLPLGTVVENSASIYFDFNAPVLTNTAWITYDVPSATQPPLPAPAIRVYPVPASTAVVVEYQRHEGQPWTLELLDLQGRRVHQATSDQGSYTLPRNGLSGGIYLYRVTTLDGRAKTGKLIFD